MEIRGTKTEPIIPQETSQSEKASPTVEQKQIGFSGQDQIDPAISNLFSELADGGAGVSPQKDRTGDGLIGGEKPEGSEEQTPLSVFDQNVELMNLFAAPFDTPAGTDEGNFFQHDLPT